MHEQRRSSQRHPDDALRAGPSRALLILGGIAVVVLVAGVLIGVVASGAPRNASAVNQADVQITFVQPASAPAAAPATAPAAPTAAPVIPTRAPIAPVRPMDGNALIAEAQIAPDSPACPVPVGQIVTETVDSAITALPITVHVYLPPCYNAQEHAYPTLYLIHGTAYEQGGWIANGLPRVADVQMSLGMLPPFIIVMPGADMRAGDASKYSWSNWGDSSYEAFVTRELIPFIEGKYSTWESRAGRAIGGISRGGYWSIEIGFANPDLFSAVGGHSPSVGQMLVGMPPNFSMLDTAKSIDSLHALRIWLDAGDDDWARIDAQNLAQDLEAQNVSHKIDIGQGSHLDEYWASRLPDYLGFYASAWPRQAKARHAVGLARP